MDGPKNISTMYVANIFYFHMQIPNYKVMLCGLYNLPLFGSITRILAITDSGRVSSLTEIVMISLTASKNIGAICPSRTGIVILINLLLDESLMVTYIRIYAHILNISSVSCIASEIRN